MNHLYPVKAGQSWQTESRPGLESGILNSELATKIAFATRHCEPFRWERKAWQSGGRPFRKPDCRGTLILDGARDGHERLFRASTFAVPFSPGTPHGAASRGVLRAYFFPPVCPLSSQIVECFLYQI